jgi:hypothetical protein
MAYAAKVRWIGIGLKATVLFRPNLLFELFYSSRLPALGQYWMPFSIYEVQGKTGSQTILHTSIYEADKLTLFI